MLTYFCQLGSSHDRGTSAQLRNSQLAQQHAFNKHYGYSAPMMQQPINWAPYGGVDNHTTMPSMQPYPWQPYYQPAPMMAPLVNNPGSMLRTQTNELLIGTRPVQRSTTAKGRPKILDKSKLWFKATV